jgi:hypothetical protein
MGDAWLEKTYSIEIEREPYNANFSSGEKEFTVAAFHAIPNNKQPETEIKFFKFFLLNTLIKTFSFAAILISLSLILYLDR